MHVSQLYKRSKEISSDVVSMPMNGIIRTVEWKKQKTKQNPPQEYPETENQ